MTIPRDCAGAGADADAARWDARLRAPQCTDADRKAFRQWCDENPGNTSAFDRLGQILAHLRDSAEHPQLRALRERAQIAERIVQGRRTLAFSVAAGFVAAGMALTLWLLHFGSGTLSARRPDAAQSLQSAATQLITTTHERRVVSLPDGTSVTLNAGTLIETEWLPGERRVRLLSGQALFRVAKDKARPFVVTAGNHTVTALGTEFDVKVEADKLQVTLVEGHVAVRGVGRAAAQPVLELIPRQQLIVDDTTSPTVHTVDVATTTGWADGQVFFTDEALSDAVVEMNRYSARQIVITDPSLGRFRVNGMFLAGNQDGFVTAIGAYYPIDAQDDGEGRIRLIPRPTSSVR